MAHPYGANLTVDGAKHNLVFLLATQHDSLYASNADASVATAVACESGRHPSLRRGRLEQRP